MRFLRDKKRSWPVRIARIAFLTVAVIGGVYAWNPQRVDLFPKDVPPQTPITPEEVGLFRPGRRVAVVVAHPDDPEFYISGTLLRLKASGAKLLLVLTTAGDKGFYPPFTTDVEANRRVRQQEQLEAAGVYGAEVVFLGGPDGRYSPDDEAKAKIAEALRDFRPEIVVTFDGDYPPKIQHRDHRNSGIATEAIAASVGAEWLLRFGTRGANLYVDTTGLWEERSRLLAIHASQFTPDKLPRIRAMVEGRAFEDGERAGTEMAEAFRATRL